MRGPRAESAHYDLTRNRIIVRLTTGIELGFCPTDAEGLQSATPQDLADIQIEAFGLGLYFPRLDADLYVPALLEGLLGSRRWIGEHPRRLSIEERKRTNRLVTSRNTETGRAR